MRFVRDALITLVVLAAVLSAVTYSRVRAGGLSADTTPGRLERAIATRLVRMSIPADARQLQNPLRSTPDAWRTIVDHYQDHCAVCHGKDGRGGTEMGQNMYPKVPDFADPAVQQLSDGALFYIIQNGIRWTGMPAWKGEHSEEETWKLVSFIRKVPTLTPDDLQPPAEKSEHQHEPHSHEASPRPRDPESR
jgi:hypothetical protein